MRKCFVCGNEDTDYLKFIKDDIKNYRCNKCGLIYTSQEHLLKSCDANHYYQSFANKIDNDKLSPITASRLNGIFDKLEALGKKGLMLDIGCQNGKTLKIAMERGWEVEGLEPFKEIEDYGKRVGIKMYGEELLKCNLPPQKYDLITMTEVIEHLTNPEREIQEVSRILKSGGLLYVTTPNYNSLMRFLLGKEWDIFYYEHLYCFSPGNIKKLFIANGFEVVEIRCDNFYPKVILNKVKNRLKSKDKMKVKYSHKDYEFREKIEKNKLLFFIKKVVNGILNGLKIGSDMKIIAIKK